MKQIMKYSQIFKYIVEELKKMGIKMENGKLMRYGLDKAACNGSFGDLLKIAYGQDKGNYQTKFEYELNCHDSSLENKQKIKCINYFIGDKLVGTCMPLFDMYMNTSNGQLIRNKQIPNDDAIFYANNHICVQCDYRTRSVTSSFDDFLFSIPYDVQEDILDSICDLQRSECENRSALNDLFYYNVDSAIRNHLNLSFFELNEKKINFRRSSIEYNRILSEFVTKIGCTDEEVYSFLLLSDEVEQEHLMSTKRKLLLNAIRKNRINLDKEEIGILDTIIDTAYTSLKEVSKFTWDYQKNYTNLNQMRIKYKERSKDLLRKIISKSTEIKLGIQNHKKVNNLKKELGSLLLEYYESVLDEYVKRLESGASRGKYFCEADGVEKVFPCDYRPDAFVTYTIYRVHYSSIWNEASIFRIPFLKLVDGIEAISGISFSRYKEEKQNVYEEYIQKKYKKRDLEELGKKLINAFNLYITSLQHYSQIYSQFINFDRTLLYQIYDFILNMKEILEIKDDAFFKVCYFPYSFELFDTFRKIDENAQLNRQFNDITPLTSEKCQTKVLKHNNNLKDINKK